jgi:hypothetical protein
MGMGLNMGGMQMGGEQGQDGMAGMKMDKGQRQEKKP